MKKICVKDIMTEGPFTIPPTMVASGAAARMKELDVGVLPVGSVDKLEGMVTDRDLTVRVMAEGKDPSKTQVQEVMTRGVRYCNENDALEDAADAMRKHGVARLVVTNGKKATGIVTMACLLRARGDRHESDKVLHKLVKPQVCSMTTKTKSAAGCECN